MSRPPLRGMAKGHRGRLVATYQLPVHLEGLNNVLPAMKNCQLHSTPISSANCVSTIKPIQIISSAFNFAKRSIFAINVLVVIICGQISSLHAANNVGECYVTVNVTGGTLPAGWSYHLQYFDTDSNWYDGAQGTSTQTFYKQQGDWNNKSIQWRCQLKLNHTNYGSAQTNTCFAGSDSVSFTVSAPAPGTPPTITSHPASQTILDGAAVIFSVSASGTAPLSYQWRKNGVNISSANSANYTINSVSSGDAANYSCYVSNTAGNATSQVAVLTINTQPVISGDLDENGIDDAIQVSNFTNNGFFLGNLSQWEVIGGGTKQVSADAQADDGMAVFCREWSTGINLKSPVFVPSYGNIMEVRLYNPGGVSSCGVFVWLDGEAYGTKLIEVEDLSFKIYRFDLSAWAGKRIKVGFGGGEMKIDYLRVSHSANAKYFAVEGAYTWQAAKGDAELRGGRMAVLDTQDKIDSSIFFLQSLGTWSDLWLGLSDELEEGVWKWINGDSLNASNWSPSEPNNIDGADYAYIWRSTVFLNGFWDDGIQSKGYLLEFDIQSLIASEWQNGVVSGHGDFTTGATATLTAIPNSGFVFSGWTGDASGAINPLTIVMNTDKIVGANFTQDLTDSDNDGISAFDELTIYGTNPSLADTDGDGISDSVELGLGRFSIVSSSLTWAQARLDAISRGGMLATFASEGERNRAMQAIGADALLDIGGLWIGATDQTVEGTWTWISGEPFTFSTWASGQPDNLNDSDFAAVAGELGGESGKWYDYRATSVRDGYILETGYSTNPNDADTDDDGLTDGFELTVGSNPFLTDTDSDRLTDYQEVHLTQTNPSLADTDNDGVIDGADDQDGDGLSNHTEINQHGTNPLLADTDADGLSDGAEVGLTRRFNKMVLGSFTHTQAAVDADARRGRLASFPDANEYSSAVLKARRNTQGYLWFGLSDEESEGEWKWLDGSSPNYYRWLSAQPDGGTNENYVVVMENLTTWADSAPGFVAAGYFFERTGLDPLDPDTDGDGLLDGAEISIHTTDPFNDDTDGDQLADGAEVNTHGSNPKSADTDGDGLNDREEVVTRGTSPSARDTDADGFDDLFEINTGFNPLLATSTPDAVSSIRTAVEFRFNAASGVNYRIEDSIDLQNWGTVESSITGQGGVVTRFYSTENQPKRYFRVRRN